MKAERGYTALNKILAMPNKDRHATKSDPQKKTPFSFSQLTPCCQCGIFGHIFLAPKWCDNDTCWLSTFLHLILCWVERLRTCKRRSFLWRLLPSGKHPFVSKKHFVHLFPDSIRIFY